MSCYVNWSIQHFVIKIDEMDKIVFWKFINFMKHNHFENSQERVDKYFIYKHSYLSQVLRFSDIVQGPSWPWSYGSWIYNYPCNLCLSPLMLWVRISIRVRCTTLCDKVSQWLVTDRWFSLGPLVSSTNKTDRHDITEILLIVTLSTIKQTNKNTTQGCGTHQSFH